MKKFYNIFRIFVITALIFGIGLPMLIYVLLTLPSIQGYMCEKAEVELSRLLDTPVEISSLSIAPFNRITLRGVTVKDNEGDTLMTVTRLGAGVNPFDAITTEQISVDYAEIVGLNIHLSKEDKNSPLNIDHIIKALQGKDPNKPKSSINLDIKTVVIRNSAVSYDVKSEPWLVGKFDLNHISVTDFRADITIPKISNEEIQVGAKRISFIEKSGLNLVDLHADIDLNPGKSLSISDFAIELPNSYLALADIKIDSSKSVNIKTIGNTYLLPSDFAPFYEQLGGIDTPVIPDIDVKLTEDNVDINKLKLEAKDKSFSLDFSGKVESKAKIDVNKSDIKEAISPQNLSLKNLRLNFTTNGTKITHFLRNVDNFPTKLTNILQNASNVAVQANIDGNLERPHITGSIASATGKIVFDATPKIDSKENGYVLRDIAFDVNTNDYDVGRLLNNSHLGTVSLAAGGTFTPKRNNTSEQAELQLNVPHIQYNGYDYSSIDITASLKDNYLVINAGIKDVNADISAELLAELQDKEPKGFVKVHIADLAPFTCNLIDRYEGYRLCSDIECGFIGNNVNDAIANLTVRDLKFTALGLPPLVMENLNFSLDGKATPAEIHLDSDFISADVEGDYTLDKVPQVVKSILAKSFPELIAVSDEELPTTDLKLYAQIKYNETLNKFLNLPLSIIYPITITGGIDSAVGNLNLSINAPYLQQKDKLIENSAICLSTNNDGNTSSLNLTTNVPTKDGFMNIVLDCRGENNRLDTDISWKIDRKRLYAGNVDLSTFFSHNEEQQIVAQLDINQSKLTFNDTTWTVNPAQITVQKGRVEVNNFDVRRENQFVTMNGVASENPDDQLVLNLLNVNLDYIFESLGIDKARLGGDATGTFYARNIFTPEPQLATPGLSVKNISYNKVVFGDAIVKSHWDNELREITLDADIDQKNGLHSYVSGGIFPLNDSLDISFDCQKINVAFLKPYMEAFTSDVSGIASGHARLFGTFKYIDLEGDIYAENLKLKIDFTNTYYTAQDSIHIRPGIIKVENIQLYDLYGNTAMLNGEVRHKFFKEPEFDFFITEAENFLSYDVNSTINPDWYGRIYGNGGATIRGVPGRVDIYVDMTTAPKSTFTFVLSDQEVANEYKFITFRDRDRLNSPDTLKVNDEIPALVKELKERMNKTQESEPSVYNMTIQVVVTPEAQLILVMDPVGGDKIKANGKGNLSMEYGSANEDLRMYGKYELTKGSYNFTLQDIILKDFTIKEGSVISFNGDPYAAQLDLKAYYSLNANLSDLDESFLQDKDLNRTNVPVHALMNVTGDIRSPGVAFDLEFPTLTSDTYRKVKSIVSTEDMMNRQIIYLLALNRFYTPDYMGSTTKGNELVSVASSTISSQLSSMLGELSDNWTIAPNFRSDKGDFSDVEVDLALSSSLLNNRLLFNGNFGYRDNSLNTNQFIGDFDLEYLLNKSGSIRLKAYNRYNDQNFYVKTATTTQGIGIVYRRDFDNVLSFLHKLKSQLRKNSEAKLQNDSTKVNNNK